jgi:hypothetical protein
MYEAVLSRTGRDDSYSLSAKQLSRGILTANSYAGISTLFAACPTLQGLPAPEKKPPGVSLIGGVP